MKKALMYASVASMIQQFNMNNIKLLLELGYQVDVTCNFEFGSTISNEKIEQFKNELIDLGVNYYHIPIPRKVTDFKNIYTSYQQSKDIMNKEQYDLIHCHSPIGGLICRKANKHSENYNNCRMIYTAHGFHFFKGNNPIKNFIFKNIEKHAAKYTDVLITINKEDYEAAKQFKLKPNGYVQYIPGIGIDVLAIQQMQGKRKDLIEELGINQDVKLLMSVGELNNNKNHKVVIEALAKLPNHYHYIICGQGHLKNALELYAKELGCEERLHLLGYRNDIIPLMKSCDIFIFPSKREGLSVALMEALASDMVCIASQIRGNNDLIHNQRNGFLFHGGENEAEEIYAIINQIAMDGTSFTSLDKEVILKKIDRINIEKGMRKVYLKN